MYSVRESGFRLTRVQLAIIKWLYTPDTHLLLGEDKDTEAPMMQADVKVMDTED